VKVASNTFHSINNAIIRFQRAGTLAPHLKEIDLEQNYFFNAARILSSDEKGYNFPANFPIHFVNNARNAATAPTETGVPANAISVITPAPALDEKPEDEQFLRPAKGSNLAQQKPPVGVPPVN
jgi:hypothetical protein